MQENAIREAGMSRAWHSQFVEGIGDLEHQDMRMVVFMADEYALASPSHAVFLIVLFKSP